MKKVGVLKRLENAGVIAVLRADSREEALEVSHAVVRGRMIGLELTFIVPQADEVIRPLVETYHDGRDIMTGAGTMLDAVTARLAIMIGTEFIISPSFSRETTEIYSLYQVPYLPGYMTITKIQTTLKSGVDIMKLFSGGTYGPSIISAFQAPLPYLSVMPAGDISLDNMASWFKVGVVAIGVDRNLSVRTKIDEFGKVTALAKQYVARFRRIKED